EYIRLDYPENPDDPSTPIELSKTAIQARADVLADVLRKEKSPFQDVAQKNNLPYETTGFFSMEEPRLQEGWSLGLLQKIFEKKPGDVVGPTETSKGMLILRVKETKLAYVPEYEEVKEKVTTAWIKNQALQLAKQKAEERLPIIQQTLQDGNSKTFADLAKAQNLKLVQTPVFSRGEYLPQVGIAKDFQDVAFSLNDQNKLSSVVETQEGAAILHLDSFVPVDQAEFEKQKENFAAQLLEDKKTQAFNEFITHLRLKANLEDRVSKLFEDNKN
ncbi:MAG: peptidyl-prolyl cis-trans isomerase, partial [Candidatus Omnitrophica bacterium]|nr:peptidyl-prolyl cis-trans isomerase [Candidatus Omnitrophota bacterium]